MSAADDARRIIAAWESGGVEALEPLVHPGFVGEVGPETSLEPDTYVGAEGVRRYFALWDEAIEDLALDLLAVEEVAPGSAVVQMRISGRGVGSGVPVSFEAWAAMVFRDGLLFRMEAGADRESALRLAHTTGG